MIREVEYFDQPGPLNTKRCIEICQKIINNNYRDLVVASTTGDTGVRFAQSRLCPPAVNLVVVSHSAGFAEEGKQEFTPENKKAIESPGGKTLTATILTHSLETALAAQHSGAYPTMVIAQTLRRLGQGTKVCCEIVMEACDAGLLPEGKDVVAVGGTSKGADTVCIIRAVASKRFLQLKVREILAKPREW
jgi:hypothetical protein